MSIPLQSWILFFVALINFGLVFVLFSRALKARENLLFVAAILCNVLWAFGDGILLAASSEAAVSVGSKLFFIAPMFTAYFLLLFAKTFKTHKPANNVVDAALALPVLILALPLFLKNDWLISSVDYSGDILLFTVNVLPFTIYSLYFSVYFGLSYIILYRHMKQSKGVDRKHLQSLLYAAILSSALALVSNLGLPLLGTSAFIWLGPIFTLFYIFLVTNSIARHQLFDIKTAVARASAYVGAIVALLLAYSALIFILSGTDTLGTNLTALQRLAFATLAVISGLMFRPMKLFFDKLTNRLFYRDSYSAQELLDELNETLVADVDVESILEKSTHIIQQNIKTSYCGFYIRETAYFPSRYVATDDKKKISEGNLEKIRQITPQLSHKIYSVSNENDTGEELILKGILNDNDIEILGRLVTTESLKVAGVGYMLLGPKQSGEIYTAEDLKLLEIISNELVLAIENALKLEEIEQFNVTLQRKIDTATKELKDNNEKLKALDVAKDEFVSMASHQLRTPLTSIKGYISMVLEGDAGEITPTQKKMLGQAYFSSQRMVYLISDLLNISRLRTGKFIIETKPVDLAELVESELKQLEEGAAAKNITLSYKKPKNFPILELDDMKIRQVVMNFVDNALYYTPQDGKITVTLKETPKSVEFTVVDSGIGVPKNEQHKLFTKFYRAENARKARPDGTGIGLFMAKKIIVTSGGSIIFNSKEGKGSTFGFSFPKKKVLTEDK